ncbi:MAG TPA: hypothetical protein DEB56_07105 [Thiobacillus sp.]|nr:hypothetical protein [Thiobacillus sp.]
MAAPWVASARANGLHTVEVTFNEAMIGADLTNPAAWTNDPAIAYVPPATTPVIASVTYSGLIAVLHLASDMTPDRIYEVRAPGTITNLALEVIDPARRWADYVTPGLAHVESGDILYADPLGGHMEDSLGLPFYELLPWSPTLSHVTLREAMWISLLSDRRASAEDVLPDDRGPLPYKGGWWADQYLPTSGDRYGSKLWLCRARGLTQETLQEARSFAEEALQPLIDDGLCARIDVLVEAQAGNRLAVQVTAYKQDGDTIVERFPDLWAAIGL